MGLKPEDDGVKKGEVKTERAVKEVKENKSQSHLQLEVAVQDKT